MNNSLFVQGPKCMSLVLFFKPLNQNKCKLIASGIQRFSL